MTLGGTDPYSDETFSRSLPSQQRNKLLKVKNFFFFFIRDTYTYDYLYQTLRTLKGIKEVNVSKTNVLGQNVSI